MDLESDPAVVEAIAKYREQYRVDTEDLWRKSLSALDAILAHGSHGDRLRAAEQVAKIRGEYAAEKHEVKGSVTLDFSSLLPKAREEPK